MMPTTEKKRVVPQSPPSEEEEPLIRIAINATDMRRLLDHLEGWDDPVAHRFRMRFSKHRMRWSQ